MATLAITLTLCAYLTTDKHKSNNLHEVKHMAIQTTPSGLHYEVLQEGTGASPKQGQKVTVHYTGWLSDNGEKGVKFDSSIDRGEPLIFHVGVGHVIPGWDEGIPLMKVGGKARLTIPAHLAYGSQGAGGVIPPNATLIFDVELLNIA